MPSVPAKTLWLVGKAAVGHLSGPVTEEGLLASPFASARLRVGVAARAWRERGNENVFLVPGSSEAGSADLSGARLCYVSKVTEKEPWGVWLGLCEAAKNRGLRLVADISDYPFDKSRSIFLHDFYSRLLEISDAVSVNSRRMGELIAAHTTRSPRLVEDAILGEMRAPEFAPGERLELLWFGHPTNFRYLRARLGELVRFSKRKPCRLTVVSLDGYGIWEWTGDVRLHHSPALETRFLRWSPGAMESAFRECDLVLLPSDPGDPWKAGASANRLAETLNAGRFAVASPLASYLPFADAAWVGQDLVEGIEWALAHPAEVVDRIRKGQAKVAAEFAADAVGRRWCELFEALLEAGAQPA